MTIDRTTVGRAWSARKCGGKLLFIGRNLGSCELRDGVAGCGAGRLP
jgi:hypothetical protein